MSQKQFSSSTIFGIKFANGIIYNLQKNDKNNSIA